MKNYSRQREVILNVLKSTTTHPTVNWIYEKSREQQPKISLGTVYRNLKQLAQEGEILELQVDDGFDHFDATTKEHIHLQCIKCGAIIDCPLPENEIEDYVEKKLKCKICNSQIFFKGICNSCIKSGIDCNN